MHQVLLSCFKTENVAEQLGIPQCKTSNKMKQLSPLPEQIYRNKLTDFFPVLILGTLFCVNGQFLIITIIYVEDILYGYLTHYVCEDTSL